MIKRFFLFLLTFLSLQQFAMAQNSQLQNFTTKEGLPQSQVYDIVQDSIGYLWLATQGGGLARFDGDEFTVFNEKSGLKSNFINALFVKNDSLFVGTYAGLSIYTNGKIKNYSSQGINRIVNLKNKIYLATNEGVFNFKNDSLQPIKSIPGIITDIATHNNGYLIATKRGLWILDDLENPKNTTKIDNADYTSLLRIGEQIIASTFDEGIKVIENQKIIQTYSEFDRVNRIQFIDNQYWIATDTKGILVVNNRFEEIQTINQSNGLVINNVRSILKDKQDNIWIATSGGGLYKLTQNNFRHFDKNSGLKGNRIYAVHKMESEVWVSNSEKGVIKIDSTGIQSMEDNGFLNVKARTIASDYENNIWIGTDGKGIIRFKREYLPKIDTVQETSKFDTIYNQLFPKYKYVTDTINRNNGLPSNWVKKIKIRNYSVWIATYSSGIVELKLDPKTRQLTGQKEYYGTQQGIKDLEIRDLDIDNTGRVWYVTKTGNLGSIINGQVRDFYRILNRNFSISTILIKGNDIYLGTLGDGIWMSNLQNPREVKQITGVKNLNSNNIYQLIFDNENNLWAGTEKGVNKIVLDANNSISDVFYFNRSDGFLGIETCQNAVTKDNNGNIWFGTMNGLTKYTPNQNQLKKSKPTISFEKIEVAYQAVDSININQFSEVLQLKPNQNHLSFQFKSVDINHPKGIEYRYKLNRNDLDSEFSPWTSKDFIDYANQTDGTYEFVVQARNIDWVESDEITFHFFIDKPLFEKSWFQQILYSGLGLIVLIITLLIVRRIKRKNKRKLEQLTLENHLLSLEQKALQLQMNPHFIFNVLNGIKAMGSEGETQQMNTTINTFATLLRSILNSSRQEEISLHDEVQTLENYLALEQQMAANKFDYKIDLQTSGIDTEEILIPPMLIQPFVENSIKHGFYQLNRKGKIDIQFLVNNDFLECFIKDNGVGIETSKQQKRQHHPSMALEVTKERIESLSKEHTLKIREENGTIISFRLPLKTDF